LTFSALNNKIFSVSIKRWKVSNKILLADDSITIQKVVELILAEEEFEIRSANDGEEALAIMSSFIPDIVLADIEMPRMNGYQLCEKIKQEPSTSNIPVILLTGAFEPIDDELAKQVNADDYIVKPFESQELIGKINAALTGIAVAEGEEAEEVSEAEALGLEVTPVEQGEEDLWAAEEISESLSLPEDEVAAAGTEELIEIEEETGAGVEIPEEVVQERAAEELLPEGQAVVPEMEVPSRDEIRKIIKDAVQEKISSSLSSLDLKEAVIAAMTPFMKDSVEKILWEVTPDLVERMLKEMLKGSLESLAKEVEKVIWETVPDLAETMISKEIERIKSEF